MPMALSDCLWENPKGCPYFDYALSFDDNVKRKKGYDWPAECQADPEYEQLAPGIARRPDQISEPLGMDRANKLAEQLNMDKTMILTDWEYECTIGVPPRDEDQQIIFQCINNLSNSNGNTNIPLSSYGLAITDDRSADVQSLCAPQAPCLEFNKLFAGPLQRIAAKCGWENKFARLIENTKLLEFGYQGNKCQELGGANLLPPGPCIVQPVRP